MAKTPVVVKVTAWQFLRDVFVTSINKGQFPIAILALVISIYCVRVPPDVLAEHGREVFVGLKNGYLVGYVLFIMTVGGWWSHAKGLRRKHYEELDRIAPEKTELQKKLLGNKVKSSKSQ